MKTNRIKAIWQFLVNRWKSLVNMWPVLMSRAPYYYSTWEVVFKSRQQRDDFERCVNRYMQRWIKSNKASLEE